MEELDVLQLPEDGPIALIDGDSLLYYEMGKPTLEEAIEGLNKLSASISATGPLSGSCNISSSSIFINLRGPKAPLTLKIS